MVDSIVAQTVAKLVKERPFTGKIKRCEAWHYVGSSTASLRRCAKSAEVEMVIEQSDGQLKKMHRCPECADTLREAVLASGLLPQHTETITRQD